MGRSTSTFPRGRLALCGSKHTSNVLLSQYGRRFTRSRHTLKPERRKIKQLRYASNRKWVRSTVRPQGRPGWQLRERPLCISREAALLPLSLPKAKGFSQPESRGCMVKNEPHWLRSSTKSFIRHLREGCTDLSKGEVPTKISNAVVFPGQRLRRDPWTPLRDSSHHVMELQPYPKACLGSLFRYSTGSHRLFKKG